MNAYDKTSIQINRCKRILDMVDDYVDCPTQDYRTALRKALMEEFEAPAIAPPVAAGSVDTLQRYELVESQHGTGYMVHWDKAMEEDEDGEWVKHTDAIAWGAQQREAGKQEVSQLILLQQPLTDAAAAWDRIKRSEERAEKAEARVKELEPGRQALQAEGKHLAPCARQCEANAFQIEVRRLEAVELDLHRKLAAEKLRADQGWARYEAANRAKNDLEKKLADATPYALKA